MEQDVLSVFGDQYLTKEKLARALHVAKRTLDRWHVLRTGPPRTYAGKKVLYRKSSIEAWLERNERVSRT
jgi:hypothetical protein